MIVFLLYQNIKELYINTKAKLHSCQNVHVFKDAVKFVLRIGSAHNIRGPADINIAQISHLSNFSDIKLWFILIYEHSKPEQIDIQY